MSNSPLASTEAPSLAQQVDSLCDRFEAACKTGDRPRIEDFLDHVPEQDRSVLLRELLILDVHYRRCKGEQPRPADYHKRFPALDPDWLQRELAPPQGPSSQPGTVIEPRHAYLASADALAAELRSLRLLTFAQLEELTAVQGDYTEPEPLATELVRRGWLTGYQARQLFLGRGPRLMIGGHLLLEPLGEGGMGQVFKARHQVMKRLVAIKLIRRGHLPHGEAVKRFEQEIEALAQLAHPNIVGAYDAGRAEDQHYFAMEYVEGTDLAKLIKQRGPLPVAEACEYVRQAALGLQHAHEQGLVHRDIKPSNLMLVLKASRERQRPEAIIKVMDLGLARLRYDPADKGSKRLTKAGEIMGTPDYIAPEQAVDAYRVDIRADIYSLGCTLYHLLTGQRPFPGGKLADKLIAHREKEPRAVEDLRPEVPATLAAVVRKMMAKRREERYQTPGEVFDALVGALRVIAPENAQGIMAPSAIPVAQVVPKELPTPDLGEKRRAARPVQRRRLAPWIGAAVVLGVGLIVLAAVFLPRGSGPPTAIEKDTGGTDNSGKKTDDELWQEAAEVWHKNLGKPEALEAAQAMARLRSPLDALDPKAIPAEERIDGQPEELVAVLGSHAGRSYAEVNCVAVSPDGDVVATGSADGRVYFWDATTLRPAGRLGSAGTGVNAVAFARFGEKEVLATAHATGVQLAVREGTGWRAVGSYRAGTVYAVAFTPDGRLLASGGSANTIQLWQVTDQGLTELTVLKGHNGNVRSLAFSPDGKLLASGSGDRSIKIWEVETRKELHAVKAYDGTVMSLAFSRTLLASGGLDSIVRLWEFADGELKQVAMIKAANEGVRSVAFTPDGKTLAVGVNGSTRVNLWNVNNKKFEAQRTIPNDPQVARVSVSVTFGPDGETLVCARSDRSVRLWDWKQDRPKERVPYSEHISAVNALGFTPDGKRLYTAGRDAQLFQWDLAEGKFAPKLLFQDRSNPINCMVVSPDGKQLAVARYNNNTPALLDASNGEILRTFTGHTTNVTCLAISPDGTRLASGCTGRTVRVWNLATGKEEAYSPLQGHNQQLFSVAFSPDGRYLASAGGASLQPSELKVWNTATGKEVPLAWDALRETRLAVFSPDGRFLAASPIIGGGGVVLAHSPTGQQAAPPLKVGSNVMSSLAFSPDSRSLAAVHGATVSWWDLADDPAKARLKSWPLPGTVQSAAFAPDSRHLAVGNGNGTVYILRLRPAATEGPGRDP